MTLPVMPLLSKSAYINGWQCPKRLWLQTHQPHDTEAANGAGGRFRKGREIGEWARQLFPAGKLVTTEPYSPEAAVDQTRALIASGARVIFEAAFTWNDCFAAVDILVRKGSSWHVYEVKSGTSVKEYYLQDMAFQYQVLKGAGISVTKCFILHVDNRYERSGAILPELLLKQVPVTRAIRNLQREVAAHTAQLKPVLDPAASCPERDIGLHCQTPHPCPYTGQCWSHIPSPSIFDIVHLGGAKKFQLYYEGIYRQDQLPEGYSLTSMQQLQVEATRSGLPVVDAAAIGQWLAKLRYPVYLLDFECFQPAVPLYHRTRPYQQIPFQFSMHKSNTPGVESGHREFLAEAGPDPRPAFIESLLDACGTEGTILAYNKAFELGRLRELARDFPEYRESLEALIARMGDLMEPFEKKWYYAPDMQGSHSIKRVLPALVPGEHYSALAIADGQQASEAYEAMFFMDGQEALEATKRDLLAYCKLDTLAMVLIMDKLFLAASAVDAP